MSVNLIEILKNAVSDKTIETIGKEVGLEPAAVKSGVSAIVPTLLAGILGKNTATSAAPSWMDSLTGLMGNKQDEADLEGMNLTDMLGKGKDLLGNLFGNKTEEVSSAIAQTAGMQKEKAEKLLSMLTPLVLGYLAKWMKSKNWTFGNLVTNLLENKSNLVAALPTGLSAAHFFNTDIPKADVETPKINVEAPKVTVTESKVTPPMVEPPKSNNNWLKWLLWLLLLGLILWIILSRGCKSCQRESVVPTDSINVVDSMKAQTDTVVHFIKEDSNKSDN
ncbi:hypothetical protein TRIP_D310098 [uncultured Paludibacter sp.]|nr:hypothetical protein TRIP_D310098 [uncultured Paludibacter sp.]